MKFIIKLNITILSIIAFTLSLRAMQSIKDVEHMWQISEFIEEQSDEYGLKKRNTAIKSLKELAARAFLSQELNFKELNHILPDELIEYIRQIIREESENLRVLREMVEEGSSAEREKFIRIFSEKFSLQNTDDCDLSTDIINARMIYSKLLNDVITSIQKDSLQEINQKVCIFREIIDFLENGKKDVANLIDESCRIIDSIGNSIRIINLKLVYFTGNETKYRMSQSFQNIAGYHIRRMGLKLELEKWIQQNIFKNSLY